MVMLAVSTVRHDDKVFQRGEEVKGLPKEVMRRLFDRRAIVDEKDYHEPEGRREFPTTPRVVRESLQVQSREANAPGGGHRQGVITQPGAEAPSDPDKLLSAEGRTGGSNESSDEPSGGGTAKKAASSNKGNE